jgi:hypothetical protein
MPDTLGGKFVGTEAGRLLAVAGRESAADSHQSLQKGSHLFHANVVKDTLF